MLFLHLSLIFLDIKLKKKKLNAHIVTDFFLFLMNFFFQ